MKINCSNGVGWMWVCVSFCRVQLLHEQIQLAGESRRGNAARVMSQWLVGSERRNRYLKRSCRLELVCNCVV
jgi:hypothetical protein